MKFNTTEIALIVGLLAVIVPIIWNYSSVLRKRRSAINALWQFFLLLTVRVFRIANLSSSSKGNFNLGGLESALDKYFEIGDPNNKRTELIVNIYDYIFQVVSCVPEADSATQDDYKWAKKFANNKILDLERYMIEFAKMLDKEYRHDIEILAYSLIKRSASRKHTFIFSSRISHIREVVKHENILLRENQGKEGVYEL